MPNKRSLMKPSRDEELFLRHWMYDEAPYQDGRGPAKQLQLRHRAIPADLATLITAAISDLADQEVAVLGPPPSEPPRWPWSEETFRTRLAEAEAALSGGGIETVSATDLKPTGHE
jgi:hypothetical protein